MTEQQRQEPRDYRSTVFLPKTDFPMKAGLPQKEPGILARWQEAGLYEQLRKARAGRDKFILHDGPPYANGDMHIGHALNHILKDMVVRTQTLLGKDAPYVPGWDCHGLPIEWKVEEEYRKKKLDKDQVDPVEFRAECRAYAAHWVDVQREQLKRLGIGGDWDNPYLTMDFQAEATIVRELLKFAESGQLYRGAKPVMWSPVEKTALAEAEVEYEDIVSTQIDVGFELISSPNESLSDWIEVARAEETPIQAVVWTTTPWTIPVNQAIAYAPEVDYVAIRIGGRILLLAQEMLHVSLARFGSAGSFWLSDGSGANIVWAGKGSDLAGTIARHPMANLFRHPGLDPGSRLPAGEAQEGSGAPGRARGDGVESDASPLPFRGGAGGGGVPETPRLDENPHPNPSPEGEEFVAASIDPASPLAEFFLRPRPFLPGDFVTTDSGTGLVHMAPDHGEDDFELCKAHGINPVFAVEGDGKYRADWAWLGGQGSVIAPKFNAPDGPICSDLRAAGGLLAASADYTHSYPHSWRSKAKVIFRCTPQWFVPMDRPLPPSDGFAATSPDGGGSISADPPPSGEVAARSADGGGRTLRQTALQAIADTRFVPDKGRNRIGAMVEGRPDWVLSRQRAWGVPITLFVDRKTGDYLVDPEVNARIVAAVREGGVDAWSDARAQEYLGDGYRAEDYERITDILDVWFDSGSTHAFVLESGRWPDLAWPADLYLEGSDQHRGWFQSSLLESCATRGRAPYDTVLTHGFTMDAKGLKMSKSLGNTVNPIKVMETNGADIVRLWALSVDYTEDHRIGDEILKGVADQYRKLRNTFRYMLGALDGFDEAERVPVEEMPELERYVLALLGRLDATLRQAVADFDFNTYVRALIEFCNEDLSAFFFDIRKDCLYCDAPADPKRRAYRSVLNTLFHALVRYAAPVIVFTAEEVWATRYPDAGSVHLLEWPEVHLPHAIELVEIRWDEVRRIRKLVTEAVEPLRREKLLGSSLQADLKIETSLWNELWVKDIDWPELLISAQVEFVSNDDLTRADIHEGTKSVRVSASPSPDHKCGRCWRHLPEVVEDGALCARCEDVVSDLELSVEAQA